MTNDDESFLSAYMDGELDPEQHQRVEAVAASPHVAEKLRGLSLVRDMVAGLPHDGWVDVSARVLQEIEARHRQGGFLRTLSRWRSGSRRILPLAGLATTAAALMIAASLAILLQTSQLERGAGPVAELGPGDVAVPSESTSLPVLEVDRHTISTALEAPASSTDNEISGALADRETASSAVTHGPGEPAVIDANELLHLRDLEHLRRFLDDPGLKRFFLVQSGPKNDSEQVVASVVEHTSHLDFFKITVSQGIVIDPRHPDAATVFAFVLDEKQVDGFHDQLKAALPGLVEHTPLDPAVATALAEISEVQSLSPKLLADVEIPREALALRTKTSGGGERPHDETEVVSPSRETGPPNAPSERESAAARALDSATKAGLATAKASSPASRDRGPGPASGTETSRPVDRSTVARPPAKPHYTVVVLVWVARPSAG